MISLLLFVMRWKQPVPRAVCPFHANVTIRVGDDAAEGHAYGRARKIIKSDGTTWKREALREEISHQLGEAVDRACPDCAREGSQKVHA